jgi:TRAP-type C4-dicarboxylate transport system permease large subunit
MPPATTVWRCSALTCPWPGLLPFIGLHLIALALITYVPWLSLALVRGF